LGNFGCEVVVERVGPQDYGRFADVSWLPAEGPVLEGLWSEGRDVTFLGVSRREFRERIQARRLGEEVGRRGHAGGGAGPPVNQAGGVSVARAQAAFVIMREKFGLVGGHVHLHWAVVLAAFAGEAEVKGLADGLALPAFFH